MIRVMVLLTCLLLSFGAELHADEKPSVWTADLLAYQRLDDMPALLKTFKRLGIRASDVDPRALPFESTSREDCARKATQAYITDESLAVAVIACFKRHRQGCF